MDIELIKERLIDVNYDCWINNDKLVLLNDEKIASIKLDKISEMSQILNLNETINMLITLFKVENKQIEPISIIDMKKQIDDKINNKFK